MNWQMKTFNMVNENWIWGLLLILLGCSEASTSSESKGESSLPYYQEATFTPQWLTPSSALSMDLHRIPPFTLINQEGDTITEQTFVDKIYVANFFFTFCPGICPKMAVNMAILQEEFEADENVLLLSHSVTPTLDSVAVLKQYALANGVKSKTWHLATGERAEIYHLGRNAYFVEEDLGLEKEVDEFLHTENFVLIDQRGHIRGVYNGLKKTDIQQLILDIAVLKKEWTNESA